MPRKTRMYLPGYTYLLSQKGHNRGLCFFDQEDYEQYIYTVSELSSRYEVSIHAYAFLPDNIYFLMTPKDKNSISSFFRAKGSRFVQYINKKYSRTGTLWEGRHKSCIVESETYLLKCYRFIELSPLTSQLVNDLDAHQWTSYGYNAFGITDKIITPHIHYYRLGVSQTERLERYRQLFSAGLPEKEHTLISNSLHFSQPLGSDDFKRNLQEKIGRPIGYMKRGRPRKAVVTVD